MSRKQFLFALVALALIALGGVLTLRAMGVEYADVQRNVRIALGLPKFWVTSFNADVSRDSERPCPTGDALVIVTGGQSNAANSYGTAPSPDRNEQTFMFYGGKCYKLRSPVLGATDDGDSLWPALGDKINALTGRPVVFINGAAGGTQIGDWLDERSHYLSRLVDQIALSRKAGLKPDAVLWIQGETDASTETAPKTYVSEQQALIDKMDALGATDPETPWVIYRSTQCMHQRSNGPDIDRAVSDYVIEKGGRLVLGPNVSSFDDEFRRDGCHMNARGRDRLVGETVATLIARNLVSPRALQSVNH